VDEPIIYCSGGLNVIFEMNRGGRSVGRLPRDDTTI